MNEHEERSRADAAQDADATQFVTVDMLPGDGPGPRRGGLWLAVLLGALVGLVLLAAAVSIGRAHPATVRVSGRP